MTATISSASASVGRPSHYPLLGAAAALLGAFIFTYDQRLFGIGLPDLRGAFGLTFDEGSWLTTAATAPLILVAPAISWLVAVFGARRVLVGPILIFAVLSFAIPFVRDYEWLLVLHFINGALLGVFVPATIMILLHNLPMRWWLAGLVAYSFRLTFSGNSGVSLAGYYLEHAGWQWIYWQGALLALPMALLMVLGTPREDIQREPLANADWGGILLLGTGLALIYAGLNQGNRLDWFESGTVTSLLAGGAALLIGFFINEALVQQPFASAKVIMSRNTGLVLLGLIAYQCTSLSNAMLIPQFLTVVRHLRPEQFGDLLLNYTALPLIATALAAFFLLRRIDVRIMIILGFTSFAIAGWMGTYITHEWSPDDFIPMALIQSLGQGLTFTGLLIFAISNTNPAHATAFAAYIALWRVNMVEFNGTAMTTWLRIREQVHSNLVGLHVSSGDNDVVQTLTHLMGRFAWHGADAEATVARATSTMASLVRREANVLSIIDGFEVTFWGAIAGLLLISLMRAAPQGPLSPLQLSAKPLEPHRSSVAYPSRA
jgi:MFS transporter, DHA2 family, multidrug resistance protein